MGLDVTATYGRASELCLTIRLTAVGAIKATAGKLYWITVRPSSSDWSISIDNSTDGSGTTVWDAGAISHSAPFHAVFDPPIPCDTGIYLEAVDHITSVTAAYV